MAIYALLQAGLLGGIHWAQRRASLRVVGLPGVGQLAVGPSPPPSRVSLSLQLLVSGFLRGSLASGFSTREIREVVASQRARDARGGRRAGFSRSGLPAYFQPTEITMGWSPVTVPVSLT